MKKFLSSKVFRLIWSLALAFLLFYLCPPCFDKTTLLVILAILVVIINGAPYIEKVPVITHISRFLVGGLFIFSGFIKANDPLGFSYKLKEYFEVFQADTGLSVFEAFAHIALPLAIIICASEIILGLMLLIGYRRDLALGLLLAQIVFFTFLTFYSACYNKVTRCGCFGDFLLLTPWESFWKDIALLILITLLIAGKENIRPLFAPMIVSAVFLLGFFLSIWFPIYAYRNLPPLDFRAYKPGMSIKENMKKAPDYKDPVYETMLVYQNTKTGELKEFNQDAYMKSKIWEDTLNWKWDTTITKLVSEAFNPPKITDFNVTDLNGMNVTDSLLNDKNYSFWLIMHEIKLTEEDDELIAKIADFYKLATAENYKFIGMTASGPSEIDAYKHRHNALFDFVSVDNTVLKTMIRSNPGLMLMKDGRVIENWHWRNFPSFTEVKMKHMK
jgi:uncharacterized membrane protein YphA (DoxX/SURF4 family)